MKLHAQARRRHPSGEHGYVLLSLLLVLALAIIFAAAIMPTVKFQIERDREEEMVHRGAQYMRAIRAYYKKFGHYPVKMEDLESTNNLRFLRKRYKDPTNCAGGTCQDFRLLHLGEVRLFGAGMMVGGPMIQPGAPGFSPGTAAAPAPLPGSDPGQALMPSTAPGAGNFAAPPPQQAQPANPDPNNPDAASSPGADANPNGGAFGQPGGQTFGGPIVGVTSFSKREGYREFNHKRKYNEWKFVYDPGLDRGFLLNEPNLQPTFIQPAQLNPTGRPGTTNANPAPSPLQTNPTPPVSNPNPTPTDEGQPQPQ